MLRFRTPDDHPLALPFPLLVGVVLTAEGFDNHMRQGSFNFAMACPLGVGMLNLRTRRRRATLRGAGGTRLSGRRRRP
ncbi:MAG: hypothetical protein MZW92_57360 [Comamonadaceae bacterium]|nr:hypothetical protein [Comamonadaceae bacterium]